MFGIHELFFLYLGRGISLSSSESDDPSTGKAISLTKKYSLIRRYLANLSRLADSCSSLILLGVGRKLSPLESIRISSPFRSFNDNLTTVSFWSLLISLCLENHRFRLVVSPEVTDDSDGIFLIGLIPSLNNVLLVSFATLSFEFCRYLSEVRLYCWYPRTSKFSYIYIYLDCPVLNALSFFSNVYLYTLQYFLWCFW